MYDLIRYSWLHTAKYNKYDMAVQNVLYIAILKFTMTVWSPGLHCITYPICNPPGSSPDNSVHDNVKESEVTMTAAKFCGGIVGPTHHHM